MRGIGHCIRQNTVTMIDYLACVSSLPDQFASSANTSSFLSGPDKHDRLYVIHSLRERLRGAGNTIPTLHKDAIPLLPYALDVPKHLAILSSSVVRNARSGTGLAFGGRAGMTGNEVDGWTLARFSDLCVDVEGQALKSVATLAQGAASAGAFNATRTNRSTSVSSTGGYNQTGSYQTGSTVQPPGQANSTPGSRGVTPTASTSASTPTQTMQVPWNAQVRRPSPSRSITTPTGPAPARGAATPSSTLNTSSPTTKPSISLSIPPSPKRKRLPRPSTAPSSTSAAHHSNDDLRPTGPENSPTGAFRYHPPEQNSPRRPEDVALPETPSTPHRSGHNARYGTMPAPGSGYQTIHRAESESFVPYHYPTAASRFQNSTEALKVGGERTEKSERRSSSARFKDFIKRPSTSSAALSSQRPKWGDQSPHSSSGEELGRSQRDVGNSGGEGYSPSSRRGDRAEASGSGGPKKKKGIFSWLGGKK
jgi:hypothetical protein